MFAPIAGMGKPLEAQAEGNSVSGGDAGTTEAAVRWDSANPGTVTWTAAGDCDAYAAYIYNEEGKLVSMFDISDSPSATSGYVLDFVSRLRCESNYFQAKKVQVEIRNTTSTIGKTEDFLEIPENMVVNFETNGGTPIASQTLGDADRNSTYDGDFVVKGAKTTKEGYTFKGWYLDSALTDNRSIYYGGESKEEIDATELRYSWMRSMVQYYNYEGTNNIEDGMIVMEALYRPEITLYAKWVPNDQAQGESSQEENNNAPQETESVPQEDEEVILPAGEGVSRIMREAENGGVEIDETDQMTGATITTVQEPSGKITVRTSGQKVNANVTIPEGICIKAADGTQVAINVQELRTYVRPVEVDSDMKKAVMHPINLSAKGMSITTSEPYTMDLSLSYENTAITDLTGSITFTVKIPEDAGIDFSKPVAVVRVHDWTPEVLDTVVNVEERTLTFTTDVFSVYGVVNVEVKAPRTGETWMNQSLLAVLFVCILTGISVLEIRRRK